MCAGSNPPSVFTIFRFAAYLNLVQELKVLFGFAPCGTAFFIPFMETSGFHHHSAPYWILFCSVANHLWLSISRSHFLYGGRSFLCRSSVSCSSSHRKYTFLIEFEYCLDGFVPMINKVPNSLFHFFLLFKSLMCFVFTLNPAF